MHDRTDAALIDAALEQQILSYFLSDRHVSDALVRMLQIDRAWFALSSHRAIFKIMLKQQHREHGPIPKNIMKRRVDRKYGLDTQEGANIMAAFAEIRVVEEVPTPNTVGALVSELADLYSRRVMAQRLQRELDGIKGSSVQQVAANVLTTASKMDKDEAKSVTAGKAVSACNKLVLEAAQHQTSPGILTGIPEIDTNTLGFYPSRLYAIAARPGGGKSRFLLNLAYNQAVLCRIPVLYFSLEMSVKDLSVLLVSRHLKLNYMNLFRGNISKDDFKRLLRMKRDWHRDPPPIGIIDIPGTVTVLQLHRELERYRLAHGIIPAVVYIDYAGIMSPKNDKKLQSFEKLDEIFKDLKQLARTWRVPIVTALQLNREAVKADRVGSEHIASSDGPIRHCDTAWAATLKSPDDEQTVVDLTYVKLRYGSKRPIQLWADWPCSFIGEMPAVVRQQLNDVKAREDAEDAKSDD